jgi:hypothetical protein
VELIHTGMMVETVKVRYPINKKRTKGVWKMQEEKRKNPCRSMKGWAGKHGRKKAKEL